MLFDDYPEGTTPVNDLKLCPSCNTMKHFTSKMCARCKTKQEKPSKREKCMVEMPCDRIKKIAKGSVRYYMTREQREAERRDVLKEKLAEIEHERWSDWQKYLHSRCIKNEDGSLTIPKIYVDRWYNQINTPYSKLSKEEQEADLRQVDRYWKLIADPSSRIPPVLDACCGGRMFWFDKHDPRALFIDERVVEPCKLSNGATFEVKPDAVMDFRRMNIESDQFNLVVFDPPHYSMTGNGSWINQKYGRLDKNTWRDDIRAGFSECFRVLKPGGVLIFKWNEYKIPLKDILALTDQRPLFGHRSGKASKTHWVTFIKL